MRNVLKDWHIAGFFIGLVFGSLFHFIYQWSNGSKFIGAIGAVNESTWEHLKLLFWPLLFYSVFEYFFVGKNYNNYFFAKMVSLYLGVILIISIFYIYTGIFGTNYFIIDILLFFFSVACSQYFSYKLLTMERQVGASVNIISLFLIILLAVSFVIFTFNPPKIELFRDPQTSQYGIIE